MWVYVIADLQESVQNHWKIALNIENVQNLRKILRIVKKIK